MSLRTRAAATQRAALASGIRLPSVSYEQVLASMVVFASYTGMSSAGHQTTLSTYLLSRALDRMAAADPVRPVQSVATRGVVE